MIVFYHCYSQVYLNHLHIGRGSTIESRTANAGAGRTLSEGGGAKTGARGPALG